MTTYDASYVPSPLSTTVPFVVTPPTRVATWKFAPPSKRRFPRESRDSMSANAGSPAIAVSNPAPDSRLIGSDASNASTSTNSGEPAMLSPFIVATISCVPTSHHLTLARYRPPLSVNDVGTACDVPDGATTCTEIASCPRIPLPVTSYSSDCTYTSLTAPQTTAAFQSDPTPTSEPPPPPKAAAKPGPGRSATSRGRSGPYVATISDVLSFATRPFTTACAIHRPTSSRMNVHPYVPSSWSTTSIVARRAPEGAVSDTSTWSPPT